MKAEYIFLVVKKRCGTLSYFCVHRKNRQKHNQNFKTATFHNKFTLFQIKPNIYI